MVGAPRSSTCSTTSRRCKSSTASRAPRSSSKGKRFAFFAAIRRCWARAFKFAQHGQCGLEISELLPHLATVADDIAVVKTLHTEEINHGPAQLMFHTGLRPLRPAERRLVGRPTAWEARTATCRRYVVLITGRVAGAGSAPVGQRLFAERVSRRASSALRATRCCSCPIRRASRATIAAACSTACKRSIAQQLADVGDPEIATRIAQYEMAFRMQTSVPELMDLSRKSRPTRSNMYGAKPGQASFANNCLLARRLVERGVRFVQLFHADWDTSQQHRSRPAGPHQGGRSADGRAGARPEAARPA